MATDKLSIKNILFTKALPNYTVPEATDDYKTFPCTDCGDKFIFESSYNDHINRKSLKVTYFCRQCSKILVFKNRCQLLYHIRSHTFKTTTINVSDLKIEPLSIQDINWTLPTKNLNLEESPSRNYVSKCYECQEIIKGTQETRVIDRAKHYMQYTDTVFSCPICLFSLPNACSLTAHLRIHFQVPPYYCPECGVRLYNKSINYPYNHDCEGFNMMRATTRLKCQHDKCNKIFHPTDYKLHLKDHLKIFYKCADCSLIWAKDAASQKKHLNCNKNEVHSFIKCQLCLMKLTNSQVTKHLYMHFKNTTERIKGQVYPCTICNVIFGDVSYLIKHQIGKHVPNKIKMLLLKVLNDLGSKTENSNIVCMKNDKMNKRDNSSNSKNGFYRVIKKCDKCLKSFIYKCDYENIETLPNECPYKCFLDKAQTGTGANDNLSIVCFLCKMKITEKWDIIKNHFAKFHNNHKCLDLKVVLTNIDNKITYSKNNIKGFKGVVGNRKNISKTNKDNSGKGKYFNNGENELSYVSNAINDAAVIHNIVHVYTCNICSSRCTDKSAFEAHIITHKDPCMAYQCLECGQCFVVKRSFSTHLLLQHGITDVNEYIDNKQCFNESALLKQPNSMKEQDEPVKENQCKICKEQFENLNDLEKHFRVHGMAFLMKNTIKTNSP